MTSWYLGLRDIHTCNFHSLVRHFYLVVNVTLIANPVSNSGQTDNSFCYKSDQNDYEPKHYKQGMKTT